MRDSPLCESAEITFVGAYALFQTIFHFGAEPEADQAESITDARFMPTADKGCEVDM
jgi:hypothetical protein